MGPGQPLRGFRDDIYFLAYAITAAASARKIAGIVPPRYGKAVAFIIRRIVGANDTFSPGDENKSPPDRCQIRWFPRAGEIPAKTFRLAR